MGFRPRAVAADLNEVIEIGRTGIDVVGATIDIGNLGDVMVGQILRLLGLVSSTVPEKEIAVLVGATGIVGEQILDREIIVAVEADNVVLGGVVGSGFIGRKFSHGKLVFL